MQHLRYIAICLHYEDSCRTMVSRKYFIGMKYTLPRDLCSSGPFAMSRDNDCIVVSTITGRVRQYDRKTSMLVSDLPDSTSSTVSMPVSFCFDDAVVCVGTETGAVRMWAVKEFEDRRREMEYFGKCQHQGMFQI